MAAALAKRGADAVFSYAGRTNSPIAQPLPTRIGGFGGADGLADYLTCEGIGQVVDATHPFAAQMSMNAVQACFKAGIPLCGFERAPWQAGPGDNWQEVPDLAAAMAALPMAPTKVFLAIGKQNLSQFSRADHHHYLLRLVDDPQLALPLSNTSVVIDRGPFTAPSDKAMLLNHKIEVIVAKNSGGSGARAKIDAARELGVPVIMVNRPKVTSRMVLGNLDQVLAWLDHSTRLGV